MKCVDCPYYWKGDNENYPQCHHRDDVWFDIPPCEQEDLDKEYEYLDEEGY